MLRLKLLFSCFLLLASLHAWDKHRVAALCLDGNDGACEILFETKIADEVLRLFMDACLSHDERGCILAAITLKIPENQISRQNVINTFNDTFSNTNSNSDSNTEKQ